MTSNIVIIGVGGIGSRHLQALSKMTRPVNIQVVDPSQESITKAKLIIENEPSSQVKNIAYYPNMGSLSKEIDVAIIAVTSGIRRKVTEELLSVSNVKNIIFEKVLFTKIEDYYIIQQLLIERNIHAWVNCARRSWEFYKSLRLLFSDVNYINITVSGKDWGLGCNSIHYLDLLAYLLDDIKEINIDISNLDKEITNSKRSKYIEFTGTLKGTMGPNKFIFISTIFDSESKIIIESDICKCIIYETVPIGTAKISKKSKDENWYENKVEFPIQYQSGLTNLVVQDILNTGDCVLTPYDYSLLLHIPIINAFLSKLRYESGPTDICNIT